MQFLYGIYYYLPSVSTSSGRMYVLSHVQLFATLWTVAHQAPLSMGFQIRILEWVAICSSRGPSPPRDQTCVSCISRWILYPWAAMEAPEERDPHTLSMGKYIGTVTIKDSLWKPKKQKMKKAQPRMWRSYTWVYIPRTPYLKKTH